MFTILKDWLATTLIGFLVVSYWRGTWTLMDIWLCNQPDDASLAVGNTLCFLVDSGFEENIANLRHDGAAVSYYVGLACTILGVLLMWWGDAWHGTKRFCCCCGDKSNNKDYKDDKKTLTMTPVIALLRFITVWILGLAAVGTWRGVWYLTDHYLLPNNVTDGSKTFDLPVPLTSWWTSSLVGALVCFVLNAGNSLLAPPAIFLLDGPGVDPPPLATTLLTAHYSLTLPVSALSQPPQFGLPVCVLDILISFIGLPIMVVWYWRGTWYLLDNYLWKFSPEPRDIHVSIGYGTIIFLLCYGITNELVFSKLNIQNNIIIGIVGRLRTFILALGTVSFWRVVWYIWDEFLLGPSQASCWISHVVGVVGLTMMGCLSCITAPPSTMGVDSIPVPDCAEDPLFCMIPVYSERLYAFAIGRQPLSSFIDVMKEEYQRMSMSLSSRPPVVLIDDDKTANAPGGEPKPSDDTPEKALEEAGDNDDAAAAATDERQSMRSSYYEMQRPRHSRRISHIEVTNLRESVLSLRKSFAGDDSSAGDLPGVIPRRSSSRLFRNR